MRIAEVIGRVTLSRQHPSLKGGRFVVVLPMPGEALLDGSKKRGEEVIAFDNLGASAGDLIGLSEGREAAEVQQKSPPPSALFRRAFPRAFPRSSRARR